jgi:hypothetical protein
MGGNNMIKVKGIIKVEKCDLEKVCAGKCTCQKGDFKFECDSYHAHVHIEAAGGTVHADHLHVHY